METRLCGEPFNEPDLAIVERRHVAASSDGRVIGDTIGAIGNIGDTAVTVDAGGRPRRKSGLGGGSGSHPDEQVEQLDASTGCPSARPMEPGPARLTSP